MTAFAVVQLIPKSDETFAKYREVAGGALAKHGGKVIAGGPNSEVLEDNGLPGSGTALLQFPDHVSAHAWINDPDLQEIHNLRRNGASTRITLLAEFAV